MAKGTGAAPAADHTITISEEFGVYWVDKRKLHTRAKKIVQFQNSTNDEIAIFFPEGGLFNELPADYQVVTIPADPGSNRRAFTVQGAQQGKKDNHFPYAVYCKETGEFAIANSNPEIIIDF
jgi:hypothetical protein